MDKISESGFIGQDGRLRMPMDRLNQEFARHKGQRVIMRVEFVSPGTSAAQLAYYYTYIVPTIVDALRERGMRMSEKQADKWLQKQCPSIFENIVPGNVAQELSIMDNGCAKVRNVDVLGYTEIKGIRDLSVSEMSDFLEWLKQYAAENLSVYIEDPKNI